MGVRFGVLGPVQVTAQGRTVEVGSRRERSLLAMLLLGKGSPISMDRLIELLWEEQLPRQPREALHVLVSRLRSRLAAVDTERNVQLLHRSAGYVLITDPDSVDLNQFTRIVEQARGTHELPERAQLLRDGLALWRGPALADVGSEWLRQRVVPGLDEARLAALELRVETDLELGRHDELVTELATLVSQNPMRERLVAARMLVLHRAGRSRDALVLYRETADRLADEFGVDVASRLRDLHTAILRDDPGLAGPTPPEPSEFAPLPPAQLPAGSPTFIGRDKELAQLLTRLTGDDSNEPRDTVVISAIDGMAGVGKTTLAVHAAHRLAADYPDGQLFVDLHGYTRGVTPAEPSDVLDRLLRALGVPGEQIPRGIDDRAALFRSRLAGKRLLLLLDNAATEHQVRPLLPAARGCLVLITSRRPLIGLEQATPLPVDVLEPDHAITLFVRVAGERVADQPDLLREVIELCGRLPLAVQLAAARLRGRPSWTLEHLVTSLSDERQRLTELRAGERSVAAALHLSYAHLSDELRRLFRLLALHRGHTIGVPAAAALAGLTACEVGPLLESLVDERLLHEPEPRVYQFHDLVRVYAAERMTAEHPEADRDLAVRRLLNWYLATADAAGVALVPHRSRPAVPPSSSTPLAFSSREQALAWSEMERANLVAACHQAAETGHLTIAWQLPMALWDLFYLRKHWSDWLVTTELGLTAARQEGDRLGEAWLCTSLGNGYWEVRQYDDALRAAQNARRIWRERSDHWGEGVALHLIASAQMGLRRYDACIDHFQQALEVHRRSDNRWGAGWTLTSLGAAYRELGRLDEALDVTQLALNAWQELGDRQGEGIALINLGDIFRHLGQLDEAVRRCSEALDANRAIGNRWGEGWALNSMAKAIYRTGDVDTARTHWQTALTIFDELGDKRAAEVRAHLSSSPSTGWTIRP